MVSVAQISQPPALQVDISSQFAPVQRDKRFKDWTPAIQSLYLAHEKLRKPNGDFEVNCSRISDDCLILQHSSLKVFSGLTDGI